MCIRKSETLVEFRFLAFWVVLDTWIGKVQQLEKYRIPEVKNCNNPCIGKVQL